MTDAQDYATEVVKKLVRSGYTAYFAGGWVRDFLLGHPSADIDIATNAPPDAILDLFPRTILVGLSFGVVIVSIDGHQFEVSTFRRDIEYKHGRRPERIELADAREDAERRDFTINGMFYDPIENVIHDYVHGREDLKKGIIRTIGNPFERFYEDRLRMIRAIRFAARFGFSIDLKTQDAIIENSNTLFPAVAFERIWQEFNKMADSPHFGQALIELHRLQLLPEIFPQLKHVHLTDIKHRVLSLDNFPPASPTTLKLLELFPSDSIEAITDIFRTLRISTKEVEEVEFIVKARQHLLNKPITEVSPLEWIPFYAHPHSSLFLAIEAAKKSPEHSETFLTQHEKQQQQWNIYIEHVRTKKPLISAAHLKAEGIVPGKEMGNLIKEAEKIAILHNLTNPEEVIHQLKQTPLWPL